MVLRKLLLQNYGPFLGPCALDLSPRGGTTAAPICLIGALNGSGKTSVLDAINIALYGPRARCSARGNLGWLDFLVAARHSDAPKDEESVIELSFDEHVEGVVRPYRVRRSWHLTNTSASERLRVMVHGGYSDEETDIWPERAEELLPLGLSNLFFFDGEQVRALASSDEPTPEIRASVKALLGLDLADRLARDLATIAARRRKDLVEASAIETVASLEGRLVALREELDRLREQQQDATAKLLTLRGKLLERAPQEDPGPPATVDSEDAPSPEEPQTRLERARAEMLELAGGALSLALVPGLLARTLARAHEEVQSEGREDLARTLSTRDRMILDLLASELGEQSIVARLRAKLEEDLAQRLSPLDPSPYLGATRESLSFARHLEAALTEAVRQAVQAHSDAAAARAALRVAELRDRAAERLLKRSESDQHPELTELLSAQARLSALEEQISSRQQELQRAEVEHGRLLKTLTEKRLQESASQRVVEASERVTGVLGAYQRLLVRRRLSELEDLTTERLRYLLRKDGLVDRVQIEPETFSLSLRSEGGRPVDKGRLSAGEQQVLAVAFLWALSDATGRDLPVVIDTPLARMDSEHRGKLVERYLPSASHQVILLSTDTEIDQHTFQRLCELGVIDRTWRLIYDPIRKSSTVREGYFWESP